MAMLSWSGVHKARLITSSTSQAQARRVSCLKNEALNDEAALDLAKMRKCQTLNGIS